MYKSLKQGDTIGIIAPASPVSVEEIQPAINIIKQQGYNIIEGTHLYDAKGYLAGTDKDRLNDLHEMFLNKSVKAILCARGGYGTPRLLDSIDYDLIKKNPKLLIGYSDITAILMAVHQKTGLTVWHGPMLRGIEGQEGNLFNQLSILSTGGDLTFDLDADNVLKAGKTSGRLLGGNLSLISSLLGTPYLPSLKGSILFLEERGEPLYRIDRMLTQLKLSGIFEDITGLISGNFIDCGESNEIKQMLLEITGNDCPLYAGFPVGHGKENRTLPLGAEAELDTELLTFNVDTSIVQD